MSTSSSVIDPRVIVPFVNATRTLVGEHLNLDTTIDRPTVKAPTPPSHEISAFITLNGTVSGSVVLSFPQIIAEKLGAPGDLAQRVCDLARKELGEVTIEISDPPASVDAIEDIPWVVVPCRCDAGEFAIEVNLKRVEEAVLAAA